MRPRVGALSVAVLCALGGSSLAVAGEFLEYYKAGLAAAESNEWSKAAEMMQKAIAGQPQAKTRIKKALYFKRYLPHFHLGKALYEGGDCTGALAAWRESEAQQVVTRFREYEQLTEGRVACQQMIDLQFALDEALQVVAGAEQQAVAVRVRLSRLPTADPAVQALLGRQAEAEARLGRARSQLETGDRALSEVEQAAAAAAEVRDEFESIRLQVEQQQKTWLSQRRQQMLSDLDALVDGARQALAASEFLQPFPLAVAHRRAAVETALTHSRAASDGSLSLGELQALKTELEKTTDDLTRASAPPPVELTEAAKAFLAREYQEVLSVLADREFSSARAGSHAHLLKAAALFSLFYLSNQENSSLLERARQEVLACHGVDPRRSPPAAVFSPSFLAFFDSQIRGFTAADGPETNAGL